MRRILAVSAVLCLVVLASVVAWRDLTTTSILSPSSVQAKRSSPSRGRLLADYAKLPLSFEPNLGQTDDRVNFLTRGDGYTVFLAGNEADIRLESASPEPANPREPQHSARATSSKTAVVKIALAQSNRHPQHETLDPQASRSNYLIGNDPAKWHRNVPQFSRVKYRNVYPGVDLIYYGNQRQLESDFVVAPGADPQQIAVQVTGADRLQLNPEGDLIVSTAAGDAFLRRPRAYQRSATGKTLQEIAANYVQTDVNLLKIKLGPYDATQPLIIDPVLAYSTYLGGTLNNFPLGIAADSAGFAYVTGFTSSTDFPTTAGTLQTAPKNTKGTVFVSKLSKDGTALVYSTFLGGTGVVGESAHAIAVNPTGEAYIIGNTSSSDFPITSATAYQSTFRGGGGFFTVLDSAGAALVYSTYLNGSGIDRLQGLAIDGNGDAYITGATTSTDFPIIPGTAIQTSNNVSGSQIGTAFLSRMNPGNVGTGSLVYSTYLGGSKEDSGVGVAVDASANAYVTGFTSSTDFPMTATHTGFQTTLRNPSGNAFVARIDTTQPQLLVYSTYLGGTPNGSGSNPPDSGAAIALGPSGDAYMVGISYAPDYPLVNPLDMASNTPNQKVVLSRIDTTKSGAPSLVYSTFFGGTTHTLGVSGHGADLGFGVALDSTGNIYIAGTSSSIDFPTTPGAPQTSRVGGQNAFLSELNPAGTAVLFSTYLGGSNDAAYSLSLDGATPPSTYITGVTSGNFPTTPSALQVVDNVTGANNNDGFVAKISPGAGTGVFASPVNLAFGNQAVNTPSAAKIVTLFNDSASTLTILGVSFTGTNAADFGQTTTCTGALAAASSCTYNITFTPTTTSAESATFSITDSDATSPQTVSLTGTGTPPPSAISLTPSTMTFGTSPQIATLTNSGTSTLTITGISFTGPNAADFGQTNTCGASLAAGANCTISVTFTASAAGTESATLNVADSDPSSPQTVALSTTPNNADFSISTPTQVIVHSGANGSIVATLTSQNGFAGNVALTCSGEPTSTTCAFSPAGVALAANGTQTATATITTTAPSMVPPPPSFRRIPGYPAALWTWLALAIVLFVFWQTRRRDFKKLAWGFAAAALFFVNSCSHVPSQGTPTGTYSLTITATSGTLTHTTTVSFVVD
jgi:hypothetical protein